ncbi:hypothetical protein GCM10023149_01150 [Mucilaginibacter gynuensis]|uniref:DUF3857 domain-containing protein n=1 Tax=Mucilaginibacter gynuensis TaxID=1302236 RepID=A0ABP8FNA3_9SPHI
MKVFVIAALLLIGGLKGIAQPYIASDIPKALLPYASAVVRNNEVSIEVKDLNNTIYHFKTAVTVLNKNGDGMAHIVVWHNKSNLIRYIKGMVYDEYGKPAGKISESSFEDANAGNDFSLFEDSRVKHFRPSVVNYPYTIEYEFEVRSKQSLNFNDWQPTGEPGVAIEKSSFKFICKPDFNIRYKETNLPSAVSVATNKDGLKVYSWNADNIKAFKPEPYSPNEEDYLGTVHIAPEKFSYGGLYGTFTNWKELGKWSYDNLLLNRDALPTATIEQVKKMVAGITNPKEKAKKIYEYMQRKTRYVSVQIGIGGYQPMLAADVDRLNYGDCKALVNYTQALYKAVGIESYYCIVEAGESKVSLLTDFSSMTQANHAILCLPFKNDTTFVECTSQKMPFGFLGDFTDDRVVLACTPNGGQLMHTTSYSPQTNLQTRKGIFAINPEGELSGNMETVFKGTQYENREYIIEEQQAERIKNLKKIYDINNFEIESLKLDQNKAILPVTTESIKLNARDYATITGSQFYFLPNIANRRTSVPREVRNRQNKVYINSGYTDDDEITYTVPSGYKLSSKPLNVNVDKPFGKFTSTITVKDNQITYKRHIQVINGTYDKEQYADLVSFYQTVADADSYNAMLVKDK